MAFLVGFLPNHYIACNGNKAMTWQVVDGHDSLFQAISSLEVDNGDAKKICKALVGNWTLGVMVATIQFLVAYVGIFSDENPFSLLNAYRPAYWLLYLFIIYPILWTRDVVLPFCRIHFSRSKKSLYRLRKTTDFELPEITQYQAPDRQFDMPKTKLMDVLFIEHILLDVVDNMHYEDVVNLSLACRAVREAVFPRNDLTMRIPKLKETCCQRGTRRACLYCNKIICFWCARRPHLPALPGRRHTTACMPYCRTCYFTSFSQHPSGYKRPCPGHNDKVPDQQQELCPTCAQKWSPKMKICRERRFAQLARDIAFGRVPLDPPIPKTQSSDVDASGTATASDAADMSGEERERDIENMVQRDKPIDGRHCGKCKIELGSGMRWWVCGICRGECRDSIHPAFVKRREMWDVDVEKAEDKDVLGEKERRGPWWRRWLRK
ncbi:hypothetical protein K458DRAFT_107330 [Lentithecium fluviatile CBS 122367]|uniref:F-box domain-containing protein n=1 Tax=Lentithecium fluviatile CBS 122367 TaxID=1168545 RepID=A0A6G1IPR1_9PLEO|nr:hypothetical protein K458DRAFT_107330 [Lentithecium fluviatile CBS 122367]